MAFHVFGDSAPSLWKNGPSPGNFYNFPDMGTSSPSDFITRTQTPVTTSSSVLGIAYQNGVMIAADTLGSYGSLARFRQCQRVIKVNNTTILGAGGDFADFQYLQNAIRQKVIDEECVYDDFNLKPKSLHSWLTRVLYNRRSQFDPFWNTIIIGGMEEGKPYLGHVDKIGTAFVTNHIATGLGSYIALPLLRDAADKLPNMTEAEAKQILIKCIQILFYRDARAFHKYEIGIVDANGARIEPIATIDVDFSIANAKTNLR